MNTIGPHGEGAFEKRHVGEEEFLLVLDELVAALRANGAPFAFIGGIASAVMGRPRPTLDMDVMVRPWEAGAVLRALGDAGFETQETFPHWLFKAARRDVVADVIFLSTGDIHLDDEMLARVLRRAFMGRMLPIVAPEDLLVMKALAHSEETPRYWYDGLSLVARSDLDWDYLLRRARHGPRCVLSFLLFARTAGLVVPAGAVRSLRRLVATGRLAA
ncbi:MAG TPA: nucleotidyltransferase [Actinomycetota bacterium]